MVSQEVNYSTPVHGSKSVFPTNLSVTVPSVKNKILPLAQPSIPTHQPSQLTPATPVTAIAPAAPQPSPITAWAYLVGNVNTGQIYLAKNVTEVLPIASLSKLTAALVARQFMNQNELVPITQQVLDVYSDAYGLELGEQFPVSEMYYPILLQSNDNAVEALAFTYGDSASTTASSTDTAFVEKMNEYAGELGMTHSHFIDASGLSDGNISTAADLFTLAKFLYEDASSDKLFTPNIFAVTTEPSIFVATTSDHGSHDFVNINPFAGTPAFIGGKTGRTNAAGETMLSIFNYREPSGQSDPIVVIVLHSDFGTREADTDKLLAEASAEIGSVSTAGK